jgi:hypothetical protein
MSANSSTVRGPFFDELEVGMIFGQSPAVTLTGGMQAVHRSIVGNRLRLSLDAALAAAVTGQAPLAAPHSSGTPRSDSPRPSPNTSRRTSSTEAWRFVATPASATRSPRSPRWTASRRTSGAKADRRPDSRRCTSSPPTSETARCWTSGAARCCRSREPTCRRDLRTILLSSGGNRPYSNSGGGGGLGTCPFRGSGSG